MTGDAPRPPHPPPATGNSREAPPPADEAFAASLRSFGPPGLAAMLIIFLGDVLMHPLSAMLVLVWARRSRTPWRDLGLAPPVHWVREMALGLVFGVILRISLRALISPWLGAPSTQAAHHELIGNTAIVLFVFHDVILGAGFGEELVFRGFMFERLRCLLGPGAVARAVIVVLTALAFGLAHGATQGFPGVVQSTIVGLVFGAFYAITGRLWLLMVAHAAFDLTALAVIYWHAEAGIAHLVFP